MPLSLQPFVPPENVKDAVPEMSPALAKFLEKEDLSSQKFLTACLCATCGITDVAFGCSRDTQCFACMNAKSACNMFELVPPPYCVGTNACFCLKCVVCVDIQSCCDFPFPVDAERHMLCCNQDKQQTVCAGASSGKYVCCNQYGEFGCLQATENPCQEVAKMFCIECRWGCIPGMNKDVPIKCAIFGTTLWEK